MAKIIVQDTEMLHNPNFNYGEFATIRNPIEFEGVSQSDCHPADAGIGR